jgi:hypothetical protein
MKRLGAVPLIAALLTAAPDALAEEPAAKAAVPHPYAYGILVGSNTGGAGQATLRYAEDDARKMAQVLRELGRYGSADMKVLVKPDSAQVLSAVDDVAQKMKAHAAKGEQAVLVFYYSGHAKANAFSLGNEELPIATLRDRLRQIPSTITLVVLDACQSGQFARVKGAEPAADFSFNSVSRLTTKGIAVMASSTAQEMSQESDALKGSFFTHHLVTALRGAADADGDGRVSLDEAYRYAYRRTLTATAATQVGMQHVTLETDFAGQGDVPVTYPADMKSQLEIPAALDGKVLVQHRASGNVVAEVQKAPGTSLRLAFTAGGYDAYVRASGKTVRCKLVLADDRVTPIDLGACEEVKEGALAKGDFGIEDESEGAADQPPQVPLPPPRTTIAPWTLEGGVGFTGHVDDAFVNRLRNFGYVRNSGAVSLPRARATIGVSHGFLPHLVLGVQATTLSGDTLERHIEVSQDAFTWDTYGFGAFVRAYTVPIGEMGPGSAHMEIYGQLQGGLTLGVGKYTTSGTGSAPATTDTYWGYWLGGAAGLGFATRGALAFFIQLGYDYAPTISNLLGDTHDSGGLSFEIGARVRFGR